MNLKNKFIDIIHDLIEEREKFYLNADLDNGSNGKYFIKRDTDYVGVGVGSVCVRSEIIQDDVKAWQDAKEEIIEELLSGDEAFFSLMENEEFKKELKEYLEGIL